MSANAREGAGTAPAPPSPGRTIVRRRLARLVYPVAARSRPTDPEPPDSVASAVSMSAICV
jgi:hypothetical protein